jgi:hypothetical protein
MDLPMDVKLQVILEFKIGLVIMLSCNYEIFFLGNGCTQFHLQQTWLDNGFL